MSLVESLSWLWTTTRFVFYRDKIWEMVAMLTASRLKEEQDIQVSYATSNQL